jgi:N4-(beta-N-acetylglucosaminyl)-L-asparaginase
MTHSTDLSRRDLITTAVGAAAAAALAPATPAVAQAREVAPPRLPVAIASHNGLAAVKLAVEKMAAGIPPVDAAVAGVNLVELDPEDVTVGYGGLPNEEGVVQLDAAVMDGATMRAGAVAAIERIKMPSRVALEIMRRTTRVMLVGDGALRFARAHGFQEEDLLTPRARKIWLYWKENAAPKDDWLPDAKEVDDPDLKWFITKYGDSAFRPTGTIHLSAVTAEGTVGCCTTTSGLAFKLPGRVGDSPLIGAGLYCDPEVGSAGGTGHGESNIVNCGAHAVIEMMRQGKSPEEACLAVLKRVADNTRLDYLRDATGRPRNNLSLYAVSRAGVAASASTWSGGKYAICRSGSEPELRDCAYLYKREA